ncbi:hypothetical protein PV682_13150 [Streptomyces niveiscabiei]|uniref:hypothetical protein n=1 Tax=Streptomyces niveiscabiei TaxID=164115 RepID=UPI0029AA9ED1|nr:hypothetical protein [Streptomyces niveiscabiei]MDX3382402.1 hypothetical protein [Streptomyces niveiscabiei]
MSAPAVRGHHLDRRLLAGTAALAAAASAALALHGDAVRLASGADGFVRWPVTALTLLWLARHDQNHYARGAVALALTGAGGLAVLVARHGVPAHETSLVQDYLDLPGTAASWYVLMALAVAGGAKHPLTRAGALLAASAVGVGAVLAAHDRLLVALLAVALPGAAWTLAGSLPLRRSG